MLVRARKAPAGLPFSTVYLAYPRDQGEYEAVLALGGWTWHHSRESASRCPAAMVGEGDVFWTTSTDDAALIRGPGVWLPEQARALEAELARNAPTISWNPSWRRFVINRTSRRLRAQLQKVGGWKFHRGACDPQWCPEDCAFRGLYGYHSPFSMSVAPFESLLSEDARGELERRRALGHRSREEDADVRVVTREGRELRPYQRAGVRWALETPRCLIGDEPGLGKTPQAIATVLSLPLEEYHSVLVVCPAGVSSNWKREIEAWSAETCRVVVLCGTVNLERILRDRVLVRRKGERLWVVTSYDTIRMSRERETFAGDCEELEAQVTAPQTCCGGLSRLTPRKRGRQKKAPTEAEIAARLPGLSLLALLLHASAQKDPAAPDPTPRCAAPERRRNTNQRGDALANRPPFPMMIVDEAHKNAGSATQQTLSCAFHASRAKRVIALTGTPLPNEVLDMQPTLAMLDPRTFERKGFSHRFCQWESTPFGARAFGMNESRAAELQDLLRSTVMLRRSKSEVLTELPPKVYRTIVLEPSEKAQELLDAQPSLEQLLADPAVQAARERRLQAESSGNTEEALAAINAELDATGVVFERAASDRMLLGMAKVKESLRYLRERGEDGRKIIVFAWHKSVVHALYEGLGGAASCVLLEGDVDPKKRGALVDSFQRDPSIQYVIATMASSAEGITLTASHTVVFVEFPWTSVAVTQCEDRAHRFTQQHTVEIDYLVFDHSMDAAIAGIIARKARYSRLGLDERAEPTPMTPAELEQIAPPFAAHPMLSKRFVLGEGRPLLIERPGAESIEPMLREIRAKLARPRSMLELLAADAAAALPPSMWTEEIRSIFA